MFAINQLSDWGIREISYGLGISEATEESGEVVPESGKLGVMVAQAAGISDLRENRVVQKVFHSSSLEDFTTGRNWFWLAYLRETNLWGNKYSPMLWGKYVSSHNGLLAIVYRYGVFSSIPYIFMIGYYLWYSMQYKEKINQKTKMDYFVLAIAGNVCILLLMENVEFPFYYISWYSLYFIMGIYFGNKPKQSSTMILGKEEV